MAVMVISEYKIAAYTSWTQLEEVVQLLINDGWKPVGGICVSNGMFYQSMIFETPYN